MPPRRPTNAEMRTREYLTADEVAALMAAASSHRDATMILVCWRHGFRASELSDLRWSQIDFAQGTMAVRRIKKGTPSTQPIMDDELVALRRLKDEQTPRSQYVFTTRYGGPFAEDSFAKLIDRLGKTAEIDFKVHPHMLRHACGFALANKGHDTRAIQGYLGHRDIKHTVLYTELAADRFAGFWRD